MADALKLSRQKILIDQGDHRGPFFFRSLDFTVRNVLKKNISFRYLVNYLNSSSNWFFALLNIWMKEWVETFNVSDYYITLPFQIFSLAAKKAGIQNNLSRSGFNLLTSSN